jgi:hypothetical protein
MTSRITTTKEAVGVLDQNAIMHGSFSAAASRRRVERWRGRAAVGHRLQPTQ